MTSTAIRNFLLGLGEEGSCTTLGPGLAESGHQSPCRRARPRDGGACCGGSPLPLHGPCTGHLGNQSRVRPLTHTTTHTTAHTTTHPTARLGLAVGGNDHARAQQDQGPRAHRQGRGHGERLCRKWAVPAVAHCLQLVVFHPRPCQLGRGAAWSPGRALSGRLLHGKASLPLLSIHTNSELFPHHHQKHLAALRSRT